MDYTRSNAPDWKFSKDAALLKNHLNEISQLSKQLTQEKLASQKSQRTLTQALEERNQQLMMMHAQQESNPWSVICAYRIPDTNFNVQFNYQRGAGNMVISCVPDESMPLLGPNGFVNGVTPGNIGVTINFSVNK